MTPKPLAEELKRIATCISHRVFQSKCEYCRERYYAIQEAQQLIVKRCAEIAMNHIGPEQIYQAILREFGLEGV